MQKCEPSQGLHLMKGCLIATESFLPLSACCALWMLYTPTIVTRVPGETVPTSLRSHVAVSARGSSPVGTSSGLSCTTSKRIAVVLSDAFSRIVTAGVLKTEMLIEELWCTRWHFARC